MKYRNYFFKLASILSLIAALLTTMGMGQDANVSDPTLDKAEKPNDPTPHKEKKSEKKEKKITPYGLLFFDFVTEHLDDSEQRETPKFTLKRAYLGIDAKISKKLKAKLQLEYAHNADYSVKKDIVKAAYLNWQAWEFCGMSGSFILGIQGTRLFKYQEKFWGYRYIEKSFMDYFGYEGSADLGLMYQFDYNQLFKLQTYIFNGDSKWENQSIRYGINIAIASKPLSFYTVYNIKADQHTFDVFFGVKWKPFRLGMEYSLLENRRNVRGHREHGFSGYTTVTAVKWLDLLLRYDINFDDSDIDRGSVDSVEKQEHLLIAGIQMTFHRSVKTAITYRLEREDITSTGELGATLAAETLQNPNHQLHLDWQFKF